MDVKAAVDLAIDTSIYDLAVESMGKLDSVTCFYWVASLNFG